MKENNSEKRILKKNILAAVLIAGVGTLVFQGVTQMAMANETGKTDIVPTSYAATATTLTSPETDSIPEGYVKAEYTVTDNDLPYYRTQTPTAKDITKEEAAEISAQVIWKIFDVELDGQVIEMGYNEPTKTMPRSQWIADVVTGDAWDYGYGAYVDSVTGEVQSVWRDRTLDVDVSLGYDSALAKNPEEYIALAKELAEKYDVVCGSIASVAYNSQGYNNNDPSISIVITGENGKMVLMGFSRYDQALRSISYNYEETLQRMQELEENLDKKPATNWSRWVPVDDDETP